MNYENLNCGWWLRSHCISTLILSWVWILSTDPMRLAWVGLKPILKLCLRYLWLDGSSFIENIDVYSFCYAAMKEGSIKMWVSSSSKMFTKLMTDSACEAEAFSLWGVRVTLKQDAALLFSVDTRKISPKIYKCFFFSRHTLKGEVKVIEENAKIWIEVIIIAATILLRQSSLYCREFLSSLQELKCWD